MWVRGRAFCPLLPPLLWAAAGRTKGVNEVPEKIELDFLFSGSSGTDSKRSKNFNFSPLAKRNAFTN